MKDSVKLAKLSILWMHLDEVAFLIATARERELKRYNMSSVQMKVLLSLNYLDRPMTIRELCRWVVRGHTAISLLTDKMAAKGLVEKYQDTQNRNQTRVAITEKGQQALYQLIPRKPIPDILSVLSDEESALLIGLLEKIMARAVAVAAPEYPPNLEELAGMIRKGIRKPST